ncbi:hypothetical protein EJB05_41703, partial [Eragrostis curvula]
MVAAAGRTAAASAMVFAVVFALAGAVPTCAPHLLELVACLAAVVWVSTDPAFLSKTVPDSGSIFIICVSGFATALKYIGAGGGARYTTGEARVRSASSVVAAAGRATVASRKGFKLLASLVMFLAETTQQALVASEAAANLCIFADDGEQLICSKMLQNAVVAMFLFITARTILFMEEWFEYMCAGGGASAVNAGHGRVRTVWAGSGVTHEFRHGVRTIGGSGEKSDFINRTGIIGTISASILSLIHCDAGSGYTTGEARVRSVSSDMAFHQRLLYICVKARLLVGNIARRLKGQINDGRGTGRAALALLWIAAASCQALGVAGQSWNVSSWNQSSSNETSPTGFKDDNKYVEDGGLAAKWGPYWRWKLGFLYLVGLGVLIGFIYLAHWFFSRVCGGAGPDDDPIPPLVQAPAPPPPPLCIVCLDEMVAGEELRTLACTHSYHSHCIAGVFQTGARRCPVCRYAVPPDDDGELEVEMV